MIKEIDGQKYVQLGDVWVPLFETAEELYEYIEEDREVH